MKTALIICCIFILPGVIMGLISSYRAGQKPIGDLYLRFKKFAQQKFRGEHMRFLIYWPFMLLFYITCLPICVIIALMDWNNGRGFKTNLREVMGQPNK